MVHDVCCVRAGEQVPGVVPGVTSDVGLLLRDADANVRARAKDLLVRLAQHWHCTARRLSRAGLETPGSEATGIADDALKSRMSLKAGGVRAGWRSQRVVAPPAPRVRPVALCSQAASQVVVAGPGLEQAQKRNEEHRTHTRAPMESRPVAQGLVACTTSDAA
eukprot:385871-Rhodomonas_salina.1